MMMMMRLIAYHRFNIWCQMRIAWLVNIKNVPNKSEPTPNTNNQMLRLHVSAWVIKLVCSPCSSPFCCLRFTTLYIINVIVMDIGSIYPRSKHTPGPRVWYGRIKTHPRILIRYWKISEYSYQGENIKARPKSNQFLNITQTFPPPQKKKKHLDGSFFNKFWLLTCMVVGL